MAMTTRQYMHQDAAQDDDAGRNLQRCPGGIRLAIIEAAHAAAGPARAVSDAAAVTAGVEAALAADRRYWARRLLTRLGELPDTTSGQRDLVTKLAEEFYAAADDIDHGAGQEACRA